MFTPLGLPLSAEGGSVSSTDSSGTLFPPSPSVSSDAHCWREGIPACPPRWHMGGAGAAALWATRQSNACRRPPAPLSTETIDGGVPLPDALLPAPPAEAVVDGGMYLDAASGNDANVTSPGDVGGGSGHAAPASFAAIGGRASRLLQVRVEE